MCGLEDSQKHLLYFVIGAILHVISTKGTCLYGEKELNTTTCYPLIRIFGINPGVVLKIRRQRLLFALFVCVHSLKIVTRLKQRRDDLHRKFSMRKRVHAELGFVKAF